MPAVQATASTGQTRETSVLSSRCSPSPKRSTYDSRYASICARLGNVGYSWGIGNSTYAVDRLELIRCVES